ncbi:MAG: glycosyltransferase [Planctomycetota bacterium]
MDLRRFTPAKRRLRTVVHVSNFRPVKRTADAVRAFYLARRHVEARLVLVGRGPEEPEVRELAARLGVLEDVLFAGEEPDVPRRLRGAAALLSTSEFEGFGMAVLEAMACGVPVVATRSGGVEEVTGGSAGLLADVGDVEALGAALARVLADAPLARNLGRAGRARAEALFDMDRIVPKYEALYERVCGARHAQDLSV